MSDESNLGWWLLAFGALAMSGGYAAGRKIHGPDADLKVARKAATRVMVDVAAFLKEVTRREKEIEPSARRFREHPELPLSVAERAYYKTGLEENRAKLFTLKQGHMALTKKQRVRVQNLSLALEAVVDTAPILARQAGIVKPQHQLGKHHPDKLLPDQGAGGGTVTVSATTPSGQPKNLRAQFGELRALLQKTLPNKDAVVAELKNKHGGLLAQLREKEPDYWKRTLENMPALA